MNKERYSRNVQYLWTVSILFVLILLNFAFLTIIASATTEGYISGYVIDSYEYDAQEGLYPDGIVVGEDSTYVYYAIVSTGDSGTEGDGYVRTIKVQKTDGDITSSVIDSLEFDTSDCYFPSICYCGNFGIGYYYAICYTDTGSSKQTIVTVNIGQTGDIANAVTDTQQMSYDGFDATSGCQIMKLSGTTYVICYTDPSADGWLETYTISDAGAITNAVIDTQEFDTTDCRFPRMCLVDSDTIAIAYSGVDTAGFITFDGWLCTYNITSGGTITNTPADSFEFDTTQGTNVDILKVSGSYIIAYEGTDADGIVMKITITSAGDIGVPTSALEHDTADSGYNRLFNIGTPIGVAVNDVYGLTYQGTSGDGYIKTFSDTNQRDVLEFDIADSLNYAPVFFINYTFWGICYAGTGNDGFVVTVGIDNEYDLTLYDTYTNTKGTHEYQIGDTGYTVWANATTTMMLRENLNTYLSGTHQSLWNSTTGNMMVWANYSGADISLGSSKHNGNFSASATYYGAPVNRWFVSIAVDDNINTIENIGNAYGSHEDKEVVSYFSASDYLIKHYSNWSVWANYTSNINQAESIVNATGTHEYNFDTVTGTWNDWANYTGTTTPIHRFENIINAIGTHDYLLNSTGYWDWANYTSNINQVENIVDATGTHEYNFDTVTGTWNDWANYTGTTTPLTLFENVLYSAGTHEYNIGVGGYNVWANYSTSLTTYENIVDASGTHDSNWDGTGWNVWANYTGDECGSTDLDIITDIVNATGSSDSDYDFDDGWTVWVNYTGDTTPIHHFTNILNATGTHEYLLNDTGYWDWANYTGNTSAVLSSYLVKIKLNGVLGFINWSGYYNSTSTNISFNVTGNATLNGTADVNLSNDVIYVAGFDLNEPFLLLSILFALFYFWWRSESVGMTYIFAMLLIPYIIVVGILYLLPLYITDSSILLFVRILFLLLAVAVGGYTVDIRSKIKKGKKETQNT